MASTPPPADPIAPVLARMQAIGAGLAPADGVACFTALYLAVTQAVDGHDLPLALIATFEQMGLSPDTNAPPHADYERVNTTLASVEKQVKARYDTGLVGVADHVLGRLDDVVATWSVEQARNAAWQHAEMLWALRDHPQLYADALDALDGLCGLAGRGLLAPVLDP